ncbi:MAG TPA: phosphate ABC transporter permease PstA [Dehalococcoidia bacterium]|nr:phosphate ABC transporter permease PstA [Dehalococcoidia bacterium]
MNRDVAYHRRKLTNTVMLACCAASALAAATVVFVILGYLFIKGINYLNVDFFVKGPAPLGEPGGGVAPSIVGSAITVGIATVIGVPVGIGTGIFLSEYAGPRAAAIIRFTADILTGIPSIVIGIFVYGLIVVEMGHFSALAAGVALAVIMLPILARSSEEMLKLVPQSQREAALALGISRWRTIVSVVLPGARAGLITGSLLAMARAAGETAPLIFTALGNRFMTTSVTGGPIDALPLRIWRYGIGPYDEWHQQAWAASFVLVMLVFLVSLVARLALAKRG